MKRYKRLGESDRITINVLSKRGFSDADIARDIGVHRATVGREKRRSSRHCDHRRCLESASA